MWCMHRDVNPCTSHEGSGGAHGVMRMRAQQVGREGKKSAIKRLYVSGRWRVGRPYAPYTLQETSHACCRRSAGGRDVTTTLPFLPNDWCAGDESALPRHVASRIGFQPETRFDDDCTACNAPCSPSDPVAFVSSGLPSRQRLRATGKPLADGMGEGLDSFPSWTCTPCSRRRTIASGVRRHTTAR